ncbi:hypothetical protein AUEXF2481DRAFT_43756 [Aureobasidium subglaciale EXF-2481]|uniref:Uncharacterized protein n=1 Tax=Aureobasidium subglaciale (strain EXF-2481) TaxID=1043005 RepID=A0A074Y756_AURSE|nr:uncharacterized protein AUEXF2481DRAFT_43756 [Aureobasidium subglaciale EXF-2481]KEQ91814.1 hypothetical protein AUEXF2481DRAFT_43756 [Aureobasidium subglaciale EXF-2481]
MTTIGTFILTLKVPPITTITLTSNEERRLRNERLSRESREYREKVRLEMQERDREREAEEAAKLLEEKEQKAKPGVFRQYCLLLIVCSLSALTASCVVGNWADIQAWFAETSSS